MKKIFLYCIAVALLVPGVVHSQSVGPVWVSDPCVPGLTVAVNDLPEYEPAPEGFGVEAKRRDDRGIIPAEVYVEPSIDILSIIQDNAELRQSRLFGTPIVNVEGMDYNGYPPDPTGSVGVSHVMQGVNGAGGSAVRILNKSGGTISTFLMETLATSTPCTNGYCDPIVLYDWMADRWLISEFDGGGDDLCIYVSKTSDPTGQWWYYTFNPPGGGQDYPKYGVWHDSYIITANNGGTIFAIDRNNMLNGQAATLQSFYLGNLSGWGFQLSMPVSHAGPTAPPSFEPGMLMRQCDGAIHAQCSSDVMQMWELDIDWVTSSNSTLTRIADVPMNSWDQTVCGTSQFGCMPQQGTTKLLDPIREPVHHPIQYRNWGTHETIVGCFVVDVNGANKSAVRWFEMRRDTGNWYVYQEGTTPNDDYHRGVCSAAMDGDGNIALGYTRTSGSSYPSSYYAGRCAQDPLGTLTFFENVCYSGSGYQSAADRWGDYAGMGVDPSDDATFWWFGMYQEGNNNNATRICSFQFDECVACNDISATIDAVTPNPACPGQTVSYSATGTGEGILTYSWDFQDDGTYDATGANVNYTYVTANTYTVRLRVSDSCPDPGSQTAYDTTVINVEPVPGTPSINTIIDESGCAQNGIRTTFTSGSSATNHNLLQDGSVVVFGYTSGALYDPGDTNSHGYRIQAVNSCGTTDSTQLDFVDVDNSSIPTINGGVVNSCPDVTVHLSTESGMSNYQWYSGGSPVAGATTADYTVTTSGSFTVSYTNLSGCSGTSAAQDVTISSCTPDIHYDTSFDPLTTLSEISGDGDATVEPGEEWQIRVQLANVGGVDATNVRADLSVNSGSANSAELSGNPGSYGSLPASGTGQTLAPYYQFRVESTATCGQTIVFDVIAISADQGNYSPALDVFSLMVGYANSENGTQQTDPLTAQSSQVVSAIAPAFTLAIADSATFSYDYTYQSSVTTTQLFPPLPEAPDDSPYSSGYWTISSGSAGTETHCSHSDTYCLLEQSATMHLTSSISTIGYTNIRVTFDGAVVNSAATLAVQYSTNSGSTWSNDYFTTNSTNWLCQQIITLPVSCEGITELSVRFLCLSDLRRAKVDYVSITGDSSDDNWTDDVQIDLYEPNGPSWNILKNYGAVDANPYDLAEMGLYTGPGTYQFRLTESAGGLAEVTNGFINAQYYECDISEGPPPEIFPLDWTDKTTLTWSSESTATNGYVLYRGLRVNLADLVDADTDFCTRHTTTDMSDTATTIDEIAPLNDCYYFIVIGVNTFGQGTAGKDSNGDERHLNTTGPC